MIDRLKKWLRANYYKSSPRKYVSYLRKRGMTIGENVDFLSCRKCHIDEGRAPFITIGSNVTICTGVTILAHDYSWSVLKEAYNEILPSGGGIVKIGSNVFLGENATILRNVTIGNNCIVAAGAVVSKSIPDNSVCAGVPAKVIMSLDEYRDKRRTAIMDEALMTIRVIKEKYGRLPTEQEMAGFRILFMPRTEENLNSILGERVLGGTREKSWAIFKDTPPMFSSYEAFLASFGDQI